MTAFNIEGLGGMIAFGTSGFAANLVSLTFPEVTVAEMETTHLGTVGAKTFKPSKIVDNGTFECEFDHDPSEVILPGQPAEQITVTYPLEEGESVAAKKVFTGFVTKQGGEEFKPETLMRTKVSIRISGAVQFTAATAASS